MNDILNEVIVGLLLGDGYIHKPYNIKSEGSNTYLAVKNLHKEYIYWLAKLFNKNNLGTNCRFGNEKGGFEGSKLSSVLETKTMKKFRDLWFEWYSYNENTAKYNKKLPNNFENIKLTPTIILHWFLGDGYLVHLHGNKERIQFCTERYSIEDNFKLIKMINQDIGLNARFDKNRNRIKIVKSELSKFYNYMGECPYEIKEPLEYKWK